MSKKLIYLISFVLVLGLVGTTSAGVIIEHVGQNDPLTEGFTQRGIGGTGSPGSDTEDYWRIVAADEVDHFYEKADVSWLADTSYTASMRVKINYRVENIWNVTLLISSTLAGVDPYQGLCPFWPGGGDENDFEYHTWQIVYDASTQECTGYKDGNSYPLTWVGDWGSYAEFGFGDESLGGATDAQYSWARLETGIHIVAGLPEPPGIAQSPDPADGATDVCLNTVLSWTEGIFAEKHDVYFGTDETKVTDANRANTLGVLVSLNQTENYYPAAGALDLDFGQTYYWRIDEVFDACDASPWQGDVWQFTTEPFVYKQLSGDKITATASSSYSAGEGPENTINGSGMVGDLHSFDTPTDMWLSDYNEPPGGAWIQYEFDKVYKLHEMWVWNYNGLRESKFGFKDVTIEYSTDGSNWTPLAGVPQFAQAPEDPDYAHNTTVTFSVVAKYVRITANENWHKGPIPAEDNYGLSEVRFYHIPMHAREESPESGTAIDGLDVVLSWRAGKEAAEHKLYLSTDEQAVIGETIAPYTIPADDSCRDSYAPLSLEYGKTYYWRVNEVNMAEIPTTWQGDVWNFTVNALVATNPNPIDGATGVSRTAVLSWTADPIAVSHDVYFGTSGASMTLQDTLPAGTEEYDPPGTLDLGQTYYWRIDEVGAYGTVTGIVWSFTTIDYLVVDDMEDYNDRDSIATIWRDGYECVDFGEPPVIPPVTGGCSGSFVDVASSVGGGTRAMVFNYDNDGETFVPGYPTWPYPAPYYSEIKANTLNLPIGSQDWTQEGVKALTLWFYGDADNDIEPMWVKLTDQGGSSGKVTYGDYGENPNDINDPSWQEWNIGLSDFGVDLTQVKDISIGFGDESNQTTPGGSGVVFFDDIRLYTPKCVLSLRSPDFARADYVEDCVVDYKEVEAMAGEWLFEAPGDANLVGHWKLDGNANDSSAYNNHGTLYGGPQWVAGKVGSGALDFDGTDDYVDCGNDASLQITGTAITETLWVKCPTLEDWSGIAAKMTSSWADGYGIYFWDGIRFFVNHYNTGAYESFPADDQWHHVAGTFDGSNVRIWVDGVEGTPFSYTGSIGDSTSPFEIGRMANSDNNNFYGTVDDVRVYNAVLTESEIQGLMGFRTDIYEDLKINLKDFAELAAWWMDEQLFP